MSTHSKVSPAARLVITGGTGFLGRHLMRTLVAHGYTNATPIGSRDYDLTHEGEVARMLDALKPEAIIHLAATVGGIGANRK